MALTVRQLDDSDLRPVMELLFENQIENLFVSSRIRVGGLDPFTLGCRIWGAFRADELVSICHTGYNLCIVGDDDEAIGAFANKLGPNRRATSIVGLSTIVQKTYQALSSKYGRSWSEVREFRWRQPMMAINKPPKLPVDERVRKILPEEFEIYFPAAVAMYTEELGISPLDGTSGYANYVKSLLRNGKAFGIIEDGKVIFKTDIGANTGFICQLQGIWVAPKFRGQGIGKAAISAVTSLCLNDYRIVSLYVNDYNRRARSIYSKLGYVEIAEMATVLY